MSACFARSTRTRVLPAVLIALAGAAACGGGSSPAAPSSSGSAAVVPPDVVLGSTAAPITMIEYSSLTCTHCADFHAATLPLIKSNYIDSGQVKLIYRDFPLDDGAALSAAMVARCSGDRFYTVIDLLYQSQAAWAGSSNVTSALKNVVAPTGMTGAEVDGCLARTDLRAGIQAMRTAGRTTYGIAGTPTFIIIKEQNQQKVEGALPYGSFDAIFKGLLPAGQAATGPAPR
jgi:protein-disulfide isomerase